MADEAVLARTGIDGFLVLAKMKSRFDRQIFVITNNIHVDTTSIYPCLQWLIDSY